MPRKKMTEEEKEAFKKRMAESRERKKQEELAEKEPTEIELLKAQIADLQKQLGNQGTTVKYVSDSSEKVHMLWQSEVADDNILYIGEGGRYGRIVGKTGDIFVPKNELANVFDERTRWYIDNRWLLILDGLTQEEKEAYNCDYKDGEILDKKAFAKLVELGDKILEIYPNLCDSHKEMIAKRYAEAYENDSPYVTRDVVVKLNELSKNGKKKTGSFVGIIEKMNQKDLGE